MAVRVVSYNVLSSHLSDAQMFVRSSAQHLDARARLPKVLALLSAEMARGSVICLQEVSRDWLGPLSVHLQRGGYFAIASNYGPQFNGFMGNALAFPTSLFALEDCSISRLADAKPWPYPPAPSLALRLWSATASAASAAVSVPGRAFRALLSLPAAMGLMARRPSAERTPDVWEEARRRSNTVIFARLRWLSGTHAGRVFCVASYHMPCAFKHPPVMVIHTALLAQRCARLAAGDPLVITGDFNIRPHSTCYRMLTRGDAGPEGSEHMPPPRAHDPWAPVVPFAMRSAYAVALGDEPPLTNAAFTREQRFVDTLDYIFVSEQWRVDGVRPLPAESELPEKLFPSEDEPSDHLLIAADLSLSQ